MEIKNNTTIDPLVSIIIPAHNGKQYLSEALESVKDQAYTSWELILVEDGSRDGAEQIIKDFAAKNAGRRVVYLRHEFQRGPSAARNTAVRSARGEYIALLDCDDLWKPSHLTEGINALKRSGADAAYSTVLVFHEGARETSAPFGPTPENLKNFPACLYGGNFITTSSVMMKKSSLKAIGLFCEDDRNTDDWDCWIRLARAGCKFVHIDGVHTLYRVHSAQTSRNMLYMYQRELFLLKKHRDWDLISKSLKRRRLSEVYMRISLLHYHQGRFFNALHSMINSFIMDPRYCFLKNAGRMFR